MSSETRGRVEFRLLGPLELAVGGALLPVGGPRQRALLAYLLLHANEAVRGARLIDALWGEDPPERVRNALQVAVHGLRKLLGRARIETVGDGYRLHVGPGELDLDRFRALVGERPADALELWRGPALADIDAPFAPAEAARLEELRVAATEARIDSELARGADDALVPELEGLIGQHPFRERLHAQLMLALYRAGRQADALETYARTRRAFSDELGLEPGPELRELEAQILRQDPALDRPAPVAPLAGVGLRVPPTSLVGRRLELAAITGLLSLPEVRLLTLTGIGGSGKTRVALAVAESIGDQYEDGAHFVDLAPVVGPELVPGAIARALGIPEVGSQDVTETLVEALRDREVLVVADNFEHVAAAAPILGDLLAEAPGVTVLATSRAPLRLASEREYPILPLPLPSAADVTDPSALARNEALELFTTRAQAVRPDFLLTSQNAASVAAICAAVDGLPLALELAAARMKALSPEALLERLRDRLDLLAARALDVPERQRTIRAAIDWSVDLLDAAERRLFAELAVFPGDFSIEAAEAVCGADVHALERLIDNSLLQHATNGRLRMLEVVRQRATELLDEARTAAEVSRLHLEFFHELAEELRPTLRGPDAEASFAILEREHDNLRVALAFARDAGLVEHQVRVARGLARFWERRGFLSEGRRWLDEALAAVKPLRTQWQGQASAGAGAIAWRQGDLDAAESYASEALDILRKLGDEQDLVGPLSVLGVVAGTRNDFERALSFHEEVGRLARATGDGYGLAVSLNNQAYAAWMTGDVDRAEARWDECLEAAREAQTSEVAALATSGLGDVALARGDAGRAGQWFRTALAIYHRLGFPELQADICVCLAAVANAEHERDRAARLLGAAASLRRGGAVEASLRTYLDDVSAAARAELGDEGFATAHAIGSADPDHAVDVELARAHVDEA